MIKPGIYGRAFDWRISRADKESLHDIAAAFVGLSADDWIDIFEDYLAITRKRSTNRIAMAKVQLHLVEEIMFAQGGAKHYRSKLQELEAASAKTDGNNANAADDIGKVRQELFLNRVFANCFRAIGDGIAWRALGYDRAALRALSGCAVQQQLLDQGIINELHHWSRSFDTGQGFAILNALTNCLAIGDVTVIKNDGELEIVEVKTSNTGSSRVSRQKQRMREVAELIRTGSGTLEGQEASIVRLDIPVENDLPTLEHLLEGAGEHGYAGSMIHNWCYVETFDSRVLSKAEGTWQQAADEARKAMSAWRDKKDFVVRALSMDLLAFTPNCAPFSVFPFSDRICAELLTTAKTYTSFLNLTELGREFERNGWRVEKWPQEFMTEQADRNTPLFRLKRDRMFSEIPPADIMRIQMELIRPQVLTRKLDAILQLGPGGVSPAGIVVYSGEKDIWT